jgi:hypothetical protein
VIDTLALRENLARAARDEQVTSTAVEERLRPALAEAEVALSAAEVKVRAAAAAVLRARVEDDLVALQRARADVERSEASIEGILRLLAGPLHTHSGLFADVGAVVRSLPWRERPRGRTDDPIAVAAARWGALFDELIAGDDS